MSRHRASSETNWAFASGVELESSETLTPACGAPRIGAGWGPFEVLELLGQGASSWGVVHRDLEPGQAREPLARCVELDPEGDFGAVAREALELTR